MDELQALHEEHMQELLHKETFPEKCRRIRRGLRLDADSGEYKWAKHEFDRLIVPGAASFLTLLVLITGLILLVKYDRDDEDITSAIVMKDMEEIEPPKMEEPPPRPDQPDTKEKEIELPDQVVEAVSEDTHVEQMENKPALAAVKSAAVTSILSTPSVALIPALSSRAPGEIGTAVAIGGGTPGTQNAVLKALRWLKQNQKPDGSWEGVSTAMTGLALLCYLAHGDTPQSEEFGHTVEMAIKYLVSQQQDDGHFKNTGGHHVYGNAIANYALSEAYAMTRIYALKEVMDKGIKVIIDGQQAGGGWDYNYKNGGRTDLSVMAWQAQALKAAGIAGSEAEGLEEAKYKAIPAFNGFQTAQGGYGYTSPANRELTGAAVLCLQLLDQKMSPEVRKGLEHMYDWQINWDSPREGGVSKNPLYHWYYITQAKFNAGGGEWDSWNKAMATVLPQEQAPDGHWSHEMAHDKSPVYSTTLTCLMLEVYYRYRLPTMKTEDGAPQTEVAKGLKALEEDHIIRVL